MSAYWNKVWGLGIVFERYACCSDDCKLGWQMVSIRIYLGPLMVLTSIRNTPKRPFEEPKP